MLKLLLLLLTVVSQFQARSQYCHDCQVIINQCKGYFKNDFLAVTQISLIEELNRLCDQNFAGYDNQQCKLVAGDKATQILNDLRHGSSAQKTCAHLQFYYCFGTEYRRGSQQLVVDDIPYADMLEFMRCIFYCPYRKHLTTANVVSVLRIANRFEMRMVVARCEAFVENAAKNLDQNKLLQVAQAVKECDPNSTTMTILVDRLASLSDKDLSAMQFNDVSGDIVANVFTHRLNTKEKGKKRYCTLISLTFLRPTGAAIRSKTGQPRGRRDRLNGESQEVEKQRELAGQGGESPKRGKGTKECRQKQAEGRGEAGQEAAKAKDGDAGDPRILNKDSVVKVDHDKIVWKDGDQQVKLTLTNGSKERRAFKMRCSDNSYFRIDPVYGYIEAKKTAVIVITLAKPLNVLQKIKVESMAVGDSETRDARDVLKDAPGNAMQFTHVEVYPVGTHLPSSPSPSPSPVNRIAKDVSGK
ncbi:unnamed protein product, partial [Mesorhabditis spiculigera]